MSNAHRSTDWRRRQTKVVRNDLVIALAQAANRQEVDILPPVLNNILKPDTDSDSDTDISISCDQDMQSPVESVSEKMTNNDENQTSSTFESIILSEKESNETICSIDIATALIALKSRHHLSNNCVGDILVLLKLLGVDVPSSYKALCTLLRKRSDLHLSPSTHTICPHCKKLSVEKHKCTACDANYSPIPSTKIPLFYTYDISRQLKAILATSKDLVLHNNRSFITLTMNIGGIQPNKGSDQSIWPVLLIINEINRKKRYSPENSIIAGMWPGPSKPSRTTISLLFKNIVADLQELEKGHLFKLYSLEHDNHFETIKVFLICACCDKPAQCLIQCLPDPIAFFGCGNCEIEGVSVPTKNDGSVVSFAIYENNTNACERTNERYDLLQQEVKMNENQLANFTGSRGRPALIEVHKNAEKGIKGPCLLRALSKFDVGRCFLVDSLHNIYLGLFKRLLSLWLSHKDKNENWSLWSRTDELSSLLDKVRFPSTTTRHPRPLHKFSKYKGSEYRLVLLFGYSIFESILKPECYSHLLLLVLAVHHAESRSLTHDMVDVVEKLCLSFLYQFPKLYTSQHNVQVVHSILHLSETLRNFGPLSTNSTFNFEDQLGVLTRSCKGTRRHAIEIMNNLMYLRDACSEAANANMHKGLQKLLTTWLHMRDAYNISSKDCVRVLHPVKITDQFFDSIFSGDIVYYSTAYIG
ncbi:unnamed protein product [Rotaria magnacalcarata]|uniref:Uncharacterized protein n=2 Tax=Rotaria magnacalcarata TaxID=392030 RepID=A0A819Z103_9BILA|nr:unnamed protein product [Rotaria magnacalcarata]